MDDPVVEPLLTNEMAIASVRFRFTCWLAVVEAVCASATNDSNKAVIMVAIFFIFLLMVQRLATPQHLKSILRMLTGDLL